VIDSQGTLTYEALNTRVDRVAHALHAAGVRPGDTVAAMLHNGRAFFEVSLGSARLGARFTPMSDKFRLREAGYVLEHSEAKVLVVSSSQLEAVPASFIESAKVVEVGLDSSSACQNTESYEAWLAAAPDTPFRPSPERRDAGEVLMYTSGTTGQPKGARRDLRNVSLFEALAILDGFELFRDEVLFICTPLYHAAPWAMSMMVLGMGGCVVVEQRWEGHATLQTMDRARVSTWLVVPTLVRRWLDLPSNERYCPLSLRKVISAGAAFPAAWKREASGTFGERFFDF